MFNATAVLYPESGHRQQLCRGPVGEGMGPPAARLPSSSKRQVFQWAWAARQAPGARIQHGLV
jgi:hypothetical protein